MKENPVLNFLESIQPSVQVGLGFLGLSHPETAAWISAFSLPVAYQFLVSSRFEREQQSLLLSEILLRLDNNEKQVSDFRTTIGEDLLIKGLRAVASSPGRERVKAIASILSKIENSEEYHYRATDFIDRLMSMNEAEWVLLRTAYELYPAKELIGEEVKSHYGHLPQVLKWTELHERFPHMTPLELNYQLSALEKTGLIMKEHGFMGDDGDSFSFPPQMTRLMKEIEDVHVE